MGDKEITVKKNSSASKKIPCFVLSCVSISGELVQIMMATANENLSAKFCNRVLKFFTKLFQLSKWSSLNFASQLCLDNMLALYILQVENA